MLVRRNTKLFKSIVHIVTDCAGRADRDELIRLYITRAGESVANRIAVEGIEGDPRVFYELTYQTVLSNLQSSNHLLHQSDDIPGLYFFRTNTNKSWDETPFEFDERISNLFADVAELPVTRKKEKIEKTTLSSPKLMREKKAQSPEKQKTPPKTVLKKATPKVKQPDYGLKREIAFDYLDRVVFRTPNFTRKTVLDYYHAVADKMLPLLKDRSVALRFQGENRRKNMYATLEALKSDDLDELPGWLKTASDDDDQLLLCNDKEHLMYYASVGVIQFDISLADVRSSEPSYVAVAIDSTDSEAGKTVEVARAFKVVLDGLRLPSFVMTDGRSGLQVGIPLERGSTSALAVTIGEMLCRLLQLKVADQVAIKGAGPYVFGKVTLDYKLNGQGERAIAPYSLVAGDRPTVATPLSWEEVKSGLKIDGFNPAVVLGRLKKGYVLRSAMKKRVDGQGLMERLERDYLFLF